MALSRVEKEEKTSDSYQHPWLGLTGVDITPDIATALGLDLEDAKGFLVIGINEGSPADIAGIRGGDKVTNVDGREIRLGGDIVLKIDNQDVRKIEDILTYLERNKQVGVGDTVQLMILRDGRPQTVNITLTARPENTQPQQQPQTEKERPSLGISGTNVTSAIAEAMNLERAQKEAEMVGEFAKDGRNRKEAQKIVKKLETEIEHKQEEKQQDTTLITEQNEQVIKGILDETKDEIKTATREATKGIPQYTQRLGDIQEQTIQTTREIADNYIESQKEIISIYQSVWTPFVENANSRFWNYWSISPKGIAETYGIVVSSFADNVIAATRLTNNAVSANMELFSTALQQTKDNSRELSRLGINAAKIFNEASNDIATTGIPR